VAFLCDTVNPQKSVTFAALKRGQVRMKNIRNFCIIAHIDHGKSTLADRLLEFTHTIGERDMQSQVLDDMDLEREKGITIKSHAIQINYKLNGEEYVLNLIDTPGHVDFSYEVSRALAACEGALLLVDASQGIQAQTISNLYLAIENNLEIIPVINKIDMDGAMIPEVQDQIVELIGCKVDDILLASGKSGIGIEEILAAIIKRIPAPKGDINAPLQALIFDSVYNSFRGIIVYYRIFNGTLKKNDKIKFSNTGLEYGADEVGILKLGMEAKSEVRAGDVGYIITGIKNAKEVKVGDTITTMVNGSTESIKGFQDVKPMVFAGIFPVETDAFEELRDCMDKLQLNDASLTFELETSQALGFGFRCGFLGMLHMEIIQERLEREFNQTVITTVPNVSFTATTSKGEVIIINNPTEMPDPTRIEKIEEPFIRAQIITKPDYIGNIMTLCIGKRGVLTSQQYLTPTRVELAFDMPLTEIVFDFYDKLKSITRGYASFDYHPIEYRPSDIVKMDILLNGDKLDALSALIHRARAHEFGRKLCEKLKDLLPRQQFQIAIQASIGAKVVARENISAIRKDVTAKCYGGDISRKRKLLEKQKEGKKRMKQIGNVEVPQEAFLAVLKLND
jgi:GTP-binding protein LepA